jgi:transglutaminase-like putative cysteine protease
MAKNESLIIKPKADITFGLTDSSFTTGEKVAIGLAIGGAVALIGGIWYYIKSSKNRSSEMLGQVVQQVKQGGMTLKVHKDPSMKIDKRLKIIQDLTWESVTDPRSRKLALEATKDCPERDGLCEAKAIFNWIKLKPIRYTGDIAAVKHPDGKIEGIDLYQAAYRTAEFGGGDCDDHAILSATLLALNGIPAKFRVTKASKSGEFSHIYTMAGLPKTAPTKWVALDTTLPGNDNFDRQATASTYRDFPV